MNFIKNNIVPIALGVFAAVLLVITLVISNEPAKKAARLAEKADKYYVNQQYDKAASFYEKARNVKTSYAKAYVGETLSYMASGKTDEARAIYSFWLNTDNSEVYDSLLEEDDKSIWTDFFLLVPELFECEEKTKLLEIGYEKLGNSVDLRPALGDAYFEMSELMFQKKEYEESFSFADKCLEFTNNANDYKDTILNRLEKYARACVASDDYDTAEKYLKRYKYLDEMLYEALYEEVSSARNIYELKMDVLSKVYENLKDYYELGKENYKEYSNSRAFSFGMMEYNFDNLIALDGATDTDKLATSFSGEYYTYSPDGFSSDFNGVGCGLYTFGDAFTLADGELGIGYCFFFGEYKNGKRNGYGILFAKNDVGSYVAYEGEFSDDEPNGYGILYENSMFSYITQIPYTKVTLGDYLNGYENGEMLSKVYLDGVDSTYFEGSFNVERGIPKTLENDPIDYGIVDETPDGYVLIAILKSVTEGETYFMPIYAKDGAKLGAVGY